MQYIFESFVVGAFSYLTFKQHYEYKKLLRKIDELNVKDTTEILVKNTQEIKTEKLYKSAFFLGIGGGGCNLLSDILKKDERFHHLYINSDEKTLRHKTNTLMLQNNSLGCGGDVACGKKLIDSNIKYKLCKALPKEKKIFLLATLGGGTGSGSTIAIAELLQFLEFDFHIITVLPFSFEGKQRMQNAQKSLEELQKITSNISIVENSQVLAKLEKQTSVKESFQMISDEVFEVMLDV